MVEAQIVEFRERTDVTPQGETQQVLVPVFQLPMFSGTRTAQPIPQSEFSRERARAAVLSLADQMVAEEEDVTVTFPTS
jgi:hypothetical protein